MKTSTNKIIEGLSDLNNTVTTLSGASIWATLIDFTNSSAGYVNSIVHFSSAMAHSAFIFIGLDGAASIINGIVGLATLDSTLQNSHYSLLREKYIYRYIYEIISGIPSLGSSSFALYKYYGGTKFLASVSIAAIGAAITHGFRLLNALHDYASNNDKSEAYRKNEGELLINILVQGLKFAGWVSLACGNPGALCFGAALLAVATILQLGGQFTNLSKNTKSPTLERSGFDGTDIESPGTFRLGCSPR